MRALIRINTRLFEEDVEALKLAAAESGLPWQIELRMLVHRAVKERAVQILDVEPQKARKKSR